MLLYIFGMSEAPIPIAVARRQYVIRLACLMACYVVVLCISLRLLHYVSEPRLRVVISLAPVVPIAFVLVAIIQLFARVDELCRRVHLEAAALAAGVTALFAITYGFLENVGMPRLSGFATFIALDVLYAVFVIHLNRRYR
jgi:hypothetical protein